MPLAVSYRLELSGSQWKDEENSMKWKSIWSYLPIEYGTLLGTIGNITQRTVLKNYLNGDKVKLQFSNVFSDEELVLEKVTISIRKPDSNEVEDTAVVTYQGDTKIRIPAGAEFYSDVVSFRVRTGQEIVISVYVKDTTDVKTVASYWSAQICHTIYQQGGDHTADALAGVEGSEVYPYVKSDLAGASVVMGFRSLYVETADDVQTIALFGDSITHMSYFSDELIKKINDKFPGKYAFINRGIGGNRLLRDPFYLESMPNGGSLAGKAGITRFEKDIYTDEIPEIVLALEGVNDLMHPHLFGNTHEMVDGDDLAGGLQKLIDISHRKGSKFYAGTVMPYYSEVCAATEESEPARYSYNEWIRTKAKADGVMDYAAVLTDETNPLLMKKGTNIGDGLHPNELGGSIMADVAIKALFGEES